MTNSIRKITATDKAILTTTFLNAGVSARLRVTHGAIRAVITGEFDRVAVAAALNNDGFRFAAGQTFSRFSFDGESVFVRGVVA